MTSKQYKMPVLDMLPIAYFVNGDNGQKNGKAGMGQEVYHCRRNCGNCSDSEAVLDDSEYDIWAEVKPRVTEAFGKVIDGAVLLEKISRQHGEKMWLQLQQRRVQS